MTLDQLLTKARTVFPNAILAKDADGNIVIEPGYYPRKGAELGEYDPTNKEE
jgi:hypothetical protein